ncbi:uncharacterized protein LOC125767303 [Anopheles funestus]|uniref:uncharacterized protein LOC125767303 n=1 Tax=Anopheles funestus TaxID=62324 RepID=UPI0020C6F646|nr:uncharacterized protein LOC125767303 [Anopheles funestus]
MILKRTLLTCTLAAVLWFNTGFGLPIESAKDGTDTIANAEDEYNPQCLPLDYLENGQSEETRVKRDDTAIVAAEETAKQTEGDELVAQPGFVAPARRRRPCFGRNKNFTKDCGPRRKAYRVKNFVMAPNPRPLFVRRGRV